MTETLKTALCALALILAILAAYAQEMTWGVEQPQSQQPAPPVVLEYLLK